MPKSVEEITQEIIDAGHKAVQELIIVAEEKIITNTDEDLSADRLKSAAATKKLAIFDAFEILNRIEQERAKLNGENESETSKGKDTEFQSFAERRSRKS
jgi:predicted outer membrane protein